MSTIRKQLAITMPPPKKPKVGRTSLEQFLSDDERVNSMGVAHLQMDSEGHSPTESVEEGSDNEVFDPATKGQIGVGGSFHISQNEGNQESLFQKLFRKSQSVDEQKVPGSPEQLVPSPPTPEGNKVGAFKSYQEHLRLQIEKRRELEIKSECISPRQEKPNNFNSVENEGMFEPSSPPRPKLSPDQGRLIDTLVASALASSAAQSIIYGGRPSQNAIATLANVAQREHISYSTCATRQYETVPHDLSKKTDINGKLGHRLFEKFSNTTDTERLQHAYREWALRQNKDFTFERNKQYLDSHRRIVGLLSERGIEGHRDERTPAHVVEKENVIQAVPARYPNGYFNHVGLNGVVGGYPRYEHQQR